jgi:hypothetical protein
VAWPTRSTLLAAVPAVAVLLMLGSPASARQRALPGVGPLGGGVDPGLLRDTVIERGAFAARAARAPPRRRTHLTADGYAIEVEVSRAYPDDVRADRALVDFLGSRIHGSELNGLRVYVGAPREIARLCGGAPGVVACYAIGEMRMYVPGERVHGVPIEYPLTHEYGHHVAAWRSNHPWSAVDWGPKHWASATRVCSHVHRGRLFPGDQGAHYLDDPGEGFADGYAHLHYPGIPWQYNRLMRPGPRGLAAVRRDVLQPWSGNRARILRGRLGPRRRARTFRIRSRLDGDLSLHLSAPRGGRYSVEARTRGFAAGRALRPGGRFGLEWCRRRGVEDVELTMRRRAGAGPFALGVSWPG